jgi:hypothetical protein
LEHKPGRSGSGSWGSAAALETEKHFRKMAGRTGIGHKDLWMLKAALEEGRLLAEPPRQVIDNRHLAA